MPAKITNVVCHEKTLLRPIATGANRNCPNDPPAVPKPNESERHFVGSNLPKAPITTVNDAPARPKPVRNPPDRYNSPGDDACAIHARPVA